MGPVKQGTAGGGALLLGVDLGDDGLPGYRLVEEFHHRLGLNTEGRRASPREGRFFIPENTKR